MRRSSSNLVDSADSLFHRCVYSRSLLSSLPRFGLCLLLVAMALPIALLAQTASTGAVAGTITDQSGAGVAGATVRLTNAATGEVHEVASRQNGNYLAPLLAPGGYQVEVSKSGFKTIVRTGIQVLVTETQTVDVVIQVGEVSERVVIRAEADILQTEGAALGNVTDEKMVEGLPLVTRNYTQILALSPGVSADVNDAS